MQQHVAFLNEYLGKDRQGVLLEVLDCFKILPLWLDLDGLLVVHACWDTGSTRALEGQSRDNNDLTDALLVKASTKNTP